MLDLMAVSDVVRKRVVDSVSLEERRPRSLRSEVTDPVAGRNGFALRLPRAPRKRRLQEPCAEAAGR